MLSLLLQPNLAAGSPTATTLNPANKAAGITLSNGNLTATGTSGNTAFETVFATTSRPHTDTASFYVNVDTLLAAKDFAVGLGTSASSVNGRPGMTGSNPGIILNAGTWGREIYTNGGFRSGEYPGASPLAQGQVIGFEMSGGVLQFKQQGLNFGDPITLPADNYFPFLMVQDANSGTANFAGWGTAAINTVYKGVKTFAQTYLGTRTKPQVYIGTRSFFP